MNQDLEKIYDNRFSASERQDKQKLWQCLVDFYLQRFFGHDSTIIDIGCGLCEFINAVKGKKKLYSEESLKEMIEKSTRTPVYDNRPRFTDDVRGSNSRNLKKLIEIRPVRILLDLLCLIDFTIAFLFAKLVGKIIVFTVHDLYDFGKKSLRGKLQIEMARNIVFPMFVGSLFVSRQRRWGNGSARSKIWGLGRIRRMATH